MNFGHLRPFQSFLSWSYFRYNCNAFLTISLTGRYWANSVHNHGIQRLHVSFKHVYENSGRKYCFFVFYENFSKKSLETIPVIVRFCVIIRWSIRVTHDLGHLKFIWLVWNDFWPWESFKSLQILQTILLYEINYFWFSS